MIMEILNFSQPAEVNSGWVYLASGNSAKNKWSWKQMISRKTQMAYFSLLLHNISHAGQIHLFRGVAEIEPLGQTPVVLQYSKWLKNIK